VKAQGIALGLRYQPTKKAPTGRNQRHCAAFFCPVGAFLVGWFITVVKPLFH